MAIFPSAEIEHEYILEDDRESDAPTKFYLKPMRAKDLATYVGGQDVVKFIKRWEGMVDENGRPVPYTGKTAGELPIGWLKEIGQELERISAVKSAEKND